MNTKELLEKRMQVWERAKAFARAHAQENGTLNADDTATYEKMEAEINDLTVAIDRARRAEERESMLSKPTTEAIKTKPSTAKVETKAGRASDSYREGMLTALRTNFRTITNELNEGTDADGGYLVPVEYDRRLIDVLEEENIMRPLATKITTSGEHRINIAATKPAAAWIEEGEAVSFGNATFDQKLMDAHKLHVAIKVTEELLYDNAFNLESYIIDQFGKALANAEEIAFLTGNGTGCPRGVLVDAETGVTAKKTNEISADEIIDLVYSLKRPYRRKASFIANDSTVAAIRKLKDGNGVYMWQPALTIDEPDRLFGYPIRTSAHAPEIAAGAKALAFGDYSYYNIGDRGTRSIQQLRELFAGNGMIGYLMKERVDGLLVLPEAVQTLTMKEA